MNSLSQTKEENQRLVKEDEENKSDQSFKKECPSGMDNQKSSCETEGNDAATFLRSESFYRPKAKLFPCEFPGCQRKFKSSRMLRIHTKEHYKETQPDSESKEIKEGEGSLKAAITVFKQFSKFSLPHFFHSKSLPVPKQLREDREIFEDLYQAYIAYSNKEQEISAQETCFDATTIS